MENEICDKYQLYSVEHERDKFWVIAVLNNPRRFKRRIQLFKEFIARMKKYNALVCVVELAYGDLNFETTDLDIGPRGIKVQVRSNTVLWQKENLINIGVSRLPNDWKYVAWIDTDVDFINPMWLQDTIHELQFYGVVQMFVDAVDLGPDDNIMKLAKSFVYCWKNQIPYVFAKEDKNISDTELYDKTVRLWHPGYAWAATRHAFNMFGGLFEGSIIGSGDHHMSCSLIGEAEKSLPKRISQDYKTQVFEWQERALRLHKQIGYVKGTIYHYWHGKKADRRYKERWDILIENNFQPSIDTYKDWQGLTVFYKGREKLREEIMDYFKVRNEDSIDL